jgi:hypothetical protein
MRNLLSALIAISVITLQGCNGNKTRVPSGQAGTPEVVFREYEHAFGKVKEGEKISWQFMFDNKGPGDLVITGVSTTCGCTVTKYDVKPVAPGESGTIEAVFDTSDRSGMQTKTITVKSNASKPIILLKITAEVESGN